MNDANEVFREIQKVLGTIAEHYPDEVFYFITKNKLRGVFSGTVNELTALLLFHALKYPMTAEMFRRVTIALDEAPQQLKDAVSGLSPIHEHIDVENDDMLGAIQEVRDMTINELILEVQRITRTK